MRLTFPVRVENGRWATIGGLDEVKAQIESLMKTRVGELPLSRSFGIWIDYNIPLEVAEGIPILIRQVIARWYPNIRVGTITPVLGEGGTVERWEVEVEEVN